MNTPLVTRFVAAATAACVTYVLFGGVVSLAGGDPRAHDIQMSKAAAQVTVASARDVRSKKL